MSKHYHVISGLQGGYIPNSNEQWGTRAGAVRGAQRHLDDYRDAGERIIGSAKAGVWQMRESESLPGTFWDYIEITGPCFDDCEEWD